MHSLSRNLPLRGFSNLTLPRLWRYAEGYLDVRTKGYRIVSLGNSNIAVKRESRHLPQTKTIIKICTYVTLIIPACAAIIREIYRARYAFKMHSTAKIDVPTPKSLPQPPPIELIPRNVRAMTTHDAEKKQRHLLLDSQPLEAMHRKEWLRVQMLAHSLDNMPKTYTVNHVDRTIPDHEWTGVGEKGVGRGKWEALLFRSTKLFSSEYPELLSFELSEQLCEALLHPTGVPPTFLPIGYKGHFALATFIPPYVLICDCGGSFAKPVTMFRYDTKALNEQTLKQIADCMAKGDEAAYIHLFTKELKTSLSFQQGDLEALVMGKCPLQQQIKANCSWRSWEAAIWSFIHLQSVLNFFKKEPNASPKVFRELFTTLGDQFDSYVAFFQLYLLERYAGVRQLRPQVSEERVDKSARVRKVIHLDKDFALLAQQEITSVTGRHIAPGILAKIEAMGELLKSA